MSDMQSQRQIRLPAKVNSWEQYGRRNAILRRIGFDTYTAYLESDLWRSIRQRVLTKTPKCQGCKASATIVHHRGYYLWNLLGQNLAGLVSLCRACHEYIEFSETDKVTLGWANSRLVELQVKNKVGLKAYTRTAPCKKCGRMCKAPTSKKKRRKIVCYACGNEKQAKKVSRCSGSNQEQRPSPKRTEK